MIRRIALVGQGPNDIGFVNGLKDRLGCDAKLVDLTSRPILRSRGSYTRSKDAKLITGEAQGADLVIRITDAAKDRWQKVVREEKKRYPNELQGRFICGACERDIEHWMALDPRYAAKQLHFEVEDLPKQRADRTGFLKHHIQRRVTGGDYVEFVSQFVRDASPQTMKQWLRNPAFRQFYDECIAAAKRANCDVNDERSRSE